MKNKFLYFFCLVLLSNCTMSGSAFLGPVYTGAKTGSIYQSSLSFSSGKVINHIKTNKIIKITELNNKNSPTDKKPDILLAYKIDKIEFSDVIEPEPLP
ncbi:hypothetical protein OA179_02130 [Candidatus Pelagibacter sp.]|nr:hypothetical protein [Candidatus Pelagibacter sp.]